MTPSATFQRFAFAYGTAFAILYVVALANDLALITVPTFGIVVLGTWHAEDAAPAIGRLPAIYWYGWTATAALGARVLGVIAALLPERWALRMSSGWLWGAPVLAMAACIYLTMPWFRL